MRHPHHVARQSFTEVGGESQVAPGPRFGRTPARPPRPAPGPGADTRAVLAEIGLGTDEVAALERDGAVAVSKDDIDRHLVAKHVGYFYGRGRCLPGCRA